MNPFRWTGRAIDPRLQVVIVAILFSTSGAAIKGCSMTGWQIAGFRAGIAAIAVMTMLPESRRGWSLKAFFIGMAYASMMILFVLANRLTTSANVIFLQSANPMFLLFLGPWLLKEHITRGDVTVVLLIAVGLGFFFIGMPAPAAMATNPFLGNILAVISGLSAALSFAGLRFLGRGGAVGTNAGLPAIAMGNLTCFLFCLPMALPVKTISTHDALTILYLGTIQIGLSYVLLTSAMRHVPALQASILLRVEPLLNPIWAWWLRDERPGIWAIVGGVIILFSTTLKSWLDSSRPKDEDGAPVDLAVEVAVEAASEESKP